MYVVSFDVKEFNTKPAGICSLHEANKIPTNKNDKIRFDLIEIYFYEVTNFLGFKLFYLKFKKY